MPVLLGWENLYPPLIVAVPRFRISFKKDYYDNSKNFREISTALSKQKANVLSLRRTEENIKGRRGSYPPFAAPPLCRMTSQAALRAAWDVFILPKMAF
jgi:hypothetical protein